MTGVFWRAALGGGGASLPLASSIFGAVANGRARKEAVNRGLIAFAESFGLAGS